MHNGKKLTLIFPAYNEESCIAGAISEAKLTGYFDEILVINNNSSDKTAEIAASAGAKVINEMTQGYGAALTRGLKEATGDYVVLCEPDNSFVIRDIEKLLSYTPDFDFVLGTRTAKELVWEGANMGPLIKWGNYAVAKFLQILFNTSHLTDCGCTFRIIKKEALSKFVDKLTVKSGHFLPEMLILAKLNGVSFIEIPVNYKKRTGLSKITGTFWGTVKTGLMMILVIVKYRIKTWLFGKD